MATIVTVHGTFAAGEKTGPSWWQEQSSFEIYIRRYVEAEDGSLSFVAHQWSGENKESARRKGGEELLEKILDIQKHDKAIAVLGHSHGGSVITNALMDSVVKNQDLTGLCRWITIGTPFITFDKKGVLLTRLPASEVYAMMVLAAATILLYLAFWASLDINAFLARIPFGPLDAYFFGSPKTEVIQQLQDGEAGRLLAHFRSAPDVFRTLSSLAALMLIFRVAEAYQRDRARHPQFAKGVEAKAGTRFGDKWLGLNHLLDEAVLMLTLLKSLRFGSIAFMAYFRGTPSGSLFTSSSRFNSNWGRHVLSSAAYYFVTILAPIIFVVWLTLVVSAAGVPVQLILRDPLSWFSEAADYYMNLEHAYLALKLLAILLAVGVVIAMVLLIVQIFFSVLLASAVRVAYTLVSAKLGNAALGVNTPGEKVSYVYVKPRWIDHGFAPLPEEYDEELSRFDDAASASLVRGVREKYAKLFAGEDLQDLLGLLNSLMNGSDKGPLRTKLEAPLATSPTYNILGDTLQFFHTNYFGSDKFRKLLCVAITQADGFRPSAELIKDPEFPRLAEQLSELKERSLKNFEGFILNYLLRRHDIQ